MFIKVKFVDEDRNLGIYYNKWDKYLTNQIYNTVAYGFYIYSNKCDMVGYSLS